ncbi:response regulator [Ruminiclostridium herbifermentans]|uniref:Stage 0 sporulation protein A homolog n=1 Tax=Ruminiclostridium herbifermentans TaxID=2488810 RepID=A0A4V6EQ47_9FIRM|nr:response regulator [Ruminiclostridium herbifermentans]QNU68225.1 response regulator [Ruminiclostridium herbifermentans]
MINIAIADVSQESKNTLKHFLEKFNNICIIGESDNESELLKIVNIYKPDIVFIEIELGESNGIEVAKKINVVSPLTNIIFKKNILRMLLMSMHMTIC